jgi:hypothetical protein
MEKIDKSNVFFLHKNDEDFVLARLQYVANFLELYEGEYTENARQHVYEAIYWYIMAFENYEEE